MTIDWIHFTPWSALAGGALIGAATALYLLGNGRIAGIAGIVGGALAHWRGEGLRLAFIAGLLAAPWLWQLASPLPATHDVAGTPLLVLAGLIVGVGVRMGNGCTSGHGVCGLARGSLRSLANVATFIAAGVATVTLLRQFGA